MEGFGGLGFSNVSNATRKRRSNTSRRPRSESQPQSELHDFSSLSSTPPSDNNLANVEDGAYGESDEASNDDSFQGSNVQRHGGVDSKRSSEGVLAPTNWKSTSMVGSFGIVSDGQGNEKKVKKVKLKVGGVIRTIDANTVSDGASGVGSSSTKSSHFSDAPRSMRKSIIKDNSDDHSLTSEKESSLRGVPWKDFPKGRLGVRQVDYSRGRIPAETTNETDKHEPVRKSKRVPKKRSLEGVLDDAEVDDEIRYLEKVKTTRVTADYDVEHGEDGGRKQRKISKVVNRNVGGLYVLDVEDYGSSRMGKEAKKSRSGRTSEDTDYMEEDEESVSDVEPENRRKRAKMEIVDFLGDSKKEMTVTTRQRALQAGKHISSSFGVSPIEFPNGLPPAPPKKQKEKLSEVEQQLKKAEAAQRRRMQVEKAARESEAEAIRKILGQDSSRKKREDKIKKRQEEMAQEKVANSMILASDFVRWVMGPSGTVVTFPDEVGLPSIFDPKPCSYPPPREKCAVPSCTNPYKYRDSKSKLPLCSLRCYKAIHKKMSPLAAC
ncbi:HIT zinc finger,PAPA-1-like conserved region, putative [Theobroma cacao]|uniref:HIT zinc finger,PAPA-1-like conserved region, putative n=1 Tax=Theobroma cacao TaxID=3641 RepID=A0A061F305_THECC|nr:HIT zinc finger,PAPA-1-like conserved region, putative [Theobroma cacao]